MPFLVVDGNGTEWIHDEEPWRNDGGGNCDEKDMYWETDYEAIQLPTGSIERLTDKIMTWKDEPFELVIKEGDG